MILVKYDFVNVGDVDSLFDIVFVVGWIGVEVCGVVFGGDIDDVMIVVICVVFNCYKVIFFCG